MGSGQEGIGEGASTEAQCGSLGSSITKLSMPGPMQEGPCSTGTEVVYLEGWIPRSALQREVGHNAGASKLCAVWSSMGVALLCLD